MGVVVREATEDEVLDILGIFATVYGDTYPYARFTDPWWLKKSVFSDDILMLVAEDEETSKILGTASVVFDVGAHSDLIGELGRLAVLPEARGRRVATLLMEKRLELAHNRLHCALVANRCVHPYSQRISRAHGFAPVGFLPLKHLFARRESIALYARHFGAALSLRDNHPRIVPEAHPLAHVALENCGLEDDAIVDEDSAPYPHADGFSIDDLTAHGLPALMRIERGRVRNREIFGPMRLQYGFFKLTAKHATYLVAREGEDGAVAAAIGYIRDDVERIVRVFELIVRTDEAIRQLLTGLLEQCREWGTDYVEIDVSAHAPRMQRTLLELGFLPAAYVPAMVFHDVERLDVVRMVRLFCPPSIGEVVLVPEAQIVADIVMSAFTRQAVLPQVASAIDALALFSGLNDEQATRLASACSVQTFEAGHVLFEEGAEPDRTYIIMDGRIGVTRAGSSVGEVRAGEIVGEVSLLTAEPHSATCTAVEKVTAASMTRNEIAELTRRRPDIGVIVFRNLAVGLGRKLQRTGTGWSSND